MGICHVAQAGLELLGSSHPFTSASQSAEFIDLSHRALPASLSSDAGCPDFGTLPSGSPLINLVSCSSAFIHLFIFEMESHSVAEVQ